MILLVERTSVLQQCQLCWLPPNVERLIPLIHSFLLELGRAFFIVILVLNQT